MATSSPTLVIVDSSALVALLKYDDVDHDKAAAIMDSTNTYTKFLAPHEVLAESLNILGKKLGKQAAVRAGELVLYALEKGAMELLETTITTIEHALKLHLAATGGPSYIDCLVMAHADEQHTPFVLGFDDTFRKNGYKLPA